MLCLTSEFRTRFRSPSSERRILGIILFIIIKGLFPFTSSAQEVKVCSTAAYAEKVYLQLTGKVFTTGNSVWFKAIVTRASDNIPTDISGVLYVEMIGPDEKIVEKKLIRLENGIGTGSIDLDQDYAEGLYQIRAYTEWDRNFGDDFFFKDYIQVFNPLSKKTTDPISNVTLLEKNKNEKYITATIDPFAVDTLHKKELSLIISMNGKKDSLSIRKNRDGKYMFDHPVPFDCQLVTMTFQSSNQVRFTKTIVLDESHVDLQFFPESGVLVPGKLCKVGFKAIDYNGKGKKVEGVIVNSNDEIITRFSSNQLGMGSFYILVADSSFSFYGRLQQDSLENYTRLFPLPAVVTRGNLLSVLRKGDKIQLIATSNYLKNDSVSIRISCRGLICFELKGCLREGNLLCSMPGKNLPEGIIAFTLLDSGTKPLAERLYFNEQSTGRVNIKVATDKNSYSKRELTRLSVESFDNEGKPLKSNLSVLVINKDQMGQLQQRNQNILSCLLLSSELKGEIESPGFYFSEDSDRFNDLDDLMLTQGWRRYVYSSNIDSVRYRAEAGLSVSGKVGGIFSGKQKKGVGLTLMTFGKNRAIETRKTDSLGRFNFNIDEEYGQHINILLQSKNSSGKNREYTISLDRKVPPPISFNHFRTVGKVDSTVHELVEKNLERKKIEDVFRVDSGDILLGEVVVEALRMTPERKKVINEYGQPDDIISGEAIQAKEEKWSYGLYSVLMFNFPGKVMIRRARDGNLYARVNPSEMTLVVIDGIPVKYYDYPFISNIPPSEVKSFEIIEGAKNFSKLFLETFPQASPLDAPEWGDVIAIYTYAGNGIYGIRPTTGLLKATVPVYSLQRQFYVPKYENIKPDSWNVPDLRALVHWEPVLKTDDQGKGSLTFYNADNVGEMQVIVEAISENGEIGYKKIAFNVKNEKTPGGFMK